MKKRPLLITALVACALAIGCTKAEPKLEPSEPPQVEPKNDLETTQYAQQPKSPPSDAEAAAADAKPNIVVIMGDDIGMWNIGAYHRGLMAGRTPNIDQLGREGVIFTDYYAEASCTAGRANFITGATADPHRPDHGRTGRSQDRDAGRRAHDCHCPQGRWVTRPDNSARITSAIGTSSCLPCTASTSSSATCITSMPWKTRFTPATRRI